MDRIEAMTCFARVAESGSFTKAASTLGLSRTTVTQLVQQLEARLRVRLLHRTTRTVKLTADGAAYYANVLKLLVDLDEAESSLLQSTAAPRGRLRVDAPAPLARRVIIPALPKFLARYPEIKLRLGVSDREVDLIADGVDCVIRGGEPAPSELIARRLGLLAFGVYAAPEYLKRFGRPAHPRDLVTPQQRVVGFMRPRVGTVRTLELRKARETVAIQGRDDIAIDDGDAYLAAGVAGLGIIGVPTYMARVHAGNGELVRLFADWEVEPMPLYVLTPPSRHPTARVRAFIEWVATLMKEGTVTASAGRRVSERHR